MNCEEIDRIVRQYAEERKHVPPRVAQEHFLARVYLVCKAGEVEPFMKRTRGLLTYYVDSLSLFENPFRNTQACWLLLMHLLFGFSLYLMTVDELRYAGIILCTGTVIFGKTLWKIVSANWLATSVLIAYYREIIDFIDRQQLTPSTETTA